MLSDKMLRIDETHGYITNQGQQKVTTVGSWFSTCLAWYYFIHRHLHFFYSSSSIFMTKNQNSSKKHLHWRCTQSVVESTKVMVFFLIVDKLDSRRKIVVKSSSIRIFHNKFPALAFSETTSLVKSSQICVAEMVSHWLFKQRWIKLMRRKSLRKHFQPWN